MAETRYIYQLDECVDWIVANQHRRIVLQFKTDDLKHSVNIVNQLKAIHRRKLEPVLQENYEPVDLYVTQSNTCCVDLIVTQHVTNVDAIVHFGDVCLSRPQIQNKEIDMKVLFAFNFLKEDFELISEQVNDIIRNLKSLHQDGSIRPTIVLYDPSIIRHARLLRDRLKGSDLASSTEVATLNCPHLNWDTNRTDQDFFNSPLENQTFGQYILPRPLKEYKGAIYLGRRLSLHLILNGPSDLWKISLDDQVEVEKVNVSRTLNKRMSLVHRLRDDDELKIGVIITNPLPNITDVMERLRGYAKAKRHTLYFISMIQTIDECKIGNFDLCDAFVIINSCTCSTILESLVFNRPILNDLEFKLACGFEAEYGRVVWPASDTHLSDVDLMNRRKVSDVSLALVHMRNDLLEHCSKARANKWSGLDYKAPVDPDMIGGTPGSGGGGDIESLTIEEGLEGVASSYSSEPTAKT